MFRVYCRKQRGCECVFFYLLRDKGEAEGHVKGVVRVFKSRSYLLSLVGLRVSL